MTPEVMTTVIFGVVMAILAILALLQGMKRQHQCKGTSIRYTSSIGDLLTLI